MTGPLSIVYLQKGQLSLKYMRCRREVDGTLSGYFKPHSASAAASPAS